MVWVRLDDSFPQHPKAIRVGSHGRDLFTCGLCYSNRFLTDGFIPEVALPQLAPGLPNPRRVADLLVNAGFWVKCDGGWQIHDFHEYQPAAREVREAQERSLAIRSAGGKARAARAPRVGGRFAPAVAPAGDQQAAGVAAGNDGHQQTSKTTSRSSPAATSSTSPAAPAPVPSRPIQKREGTHPHSSSGAALGRMVKGRGNNKGDGKVLEGYQEAVDYWFREFERTQGTKPQFDQAEGANLKKLLTAHPLSHVKALMTHMPRSRLRHIRERHAFTIHTLLGSWNELWSEYRQRAAEEGEAIP